MSTVDRPDPPDLGDCPEDWENECVTHDGNKWVVVMNCDCSRAADLRDARNKYTNPNEEDGR